jgi:hypothetical protein
MREVEGMIVSIKYGEHKEGRRKKELKECHPRCVYQNYNG